MPQDFSFVSRRSVLQGGAALAVGSGLVAAGLSPTVAGAAEAVDVPGLGKPETRPSYPVYEPEGAYRYGFALVGAAKLALKSYGDEIDPNVSPQFLRPEDMLVFKSTPGEYEPGAFVIYAPNGLDDLDIAVTSLTGQGETVSPDAIAVSRIVRTDWRNRRLGNPSVLTNRFVMPWEPMTIPAGEFREIWLTIKVPDEAEPGDYSGSVTLTWKGGSTSIPVRLTVYPFTLGVSREKRLGMYHHMGRYSTINYSQDTRRLVSELRDMREHGVTDLLLAHDDVDIFYTRVGAAIVPDYSRIEQSLEIIRRAGYVDPTVVIGSGIVPLGKLLGHLSGINRNPKILTSREAIENDAEYARIAGQGLAGLESLLRRYPKFKIVLAHSDELFRSGVEESRIADYITLSKVVRKVSKLPLYITFHTAYPENDAMRQTIDPWVDIRGHHGSTFQMWLARGNTVTQYKQELARAGDEAWNYYNPDGPWMHASWYRIINGLYLWASPFTTQAPYTYQFYLYNPYYDAGRDVIYGFSFPHPDTDYRQVSTTIWETSRQGYNDTRYFLKLQRQIRAVRSRYERVPRGRDPVADQLMQNAEKAEAFLQDLDGLVTRLVTVPETEPIGPVSYDAEGNLDFEATTRIHPFNYKTADESQITNALDHRFDGKSWQKIREIAAEHIKSLT